MKAIKILSLVTILLIVTVLWYQQKPDQDSDWTDQYVDKIEEKPHTHGDFLVYIGSQQLDFTADKYQSTKESIKSEQVHLHDNKGDVIHFHAEGVTLATFFASIGFTLTDDCLTTDTNESYCRDEDNVLELYINGQLVNDLPNHLINDEEKLLLYYGVKNPPGLQQYLEEISDEACLYSGTCPERGTPPPEECGLTCEL